MQKPRLSQLALTTVLSISALTLLGGCGSAAETAEVEDYGTQTHAAAMSMLGADISSLQRTLDLGKKFYDSAGVQKDPHDLLKAAGANYARFRVWNAPPSNYNNKPKVLQAAKAAKNKGMKILIDLHYSDWWADPGQQNKPAAWWTHNIGQLESDVYNHTYDMCNALKAQGTTPDSMQIGNEINMGMLWNEGKIVNNDFTNLARLLKAGYSAVKACNSGTQVFIHTANANSMANARWFYDGIKAKGVNWDVTALSYYCYWHGSMSNMTNVVADMKNRYGKAVVIVETGYPFTEANADGQPNLVSGPSLCGYPATWAGQGQAFTAIQNAARNGGAAGVFYWEATWYAVPGNGWDPTNINGTGNSWDNQAVFDWGGKMNPNVRWTP